MTKSLVGDDALCLLLDAQRARRFLRDLRDQPFVAIVVHEGKLRVYSKGMDAGSTLRSIKDVIQQLDDDEETNADT